jgi:hypothetical protein
MKVAGSLRAEHLVGKRDMPQNPSGARVKSAAVTLLSSATSLGNIQAAH